MPTPFARNIEEIMLVTIGFQGSTDERNRRRRESTKKKTRAMLQEEYVR